MGTVLPRYLVYGKDVMIVKKMEATAEVGTIQVCLGTPFFVQTLIIHNLGFNLKKRISFDITHR